MPAEIGAINLDQPAIPSCNNEDTLSCDRPPSSVSTSSEGMDTLERWDDRHVRLLITCYSELRHLFGKGKHTKREIFTRIAFNFNKQSEQMVTGDQCQRKWNKLESKFKEIEDHNKKTGNDKKTMKFYDEL